jgi:hypothetical protein
MDVIKHAKNVEKRKRRSNQLRRNKFKKKQKKKKTGREDVIRMGVVT